MSVDFVNLEDILQIALKDAVNNVLTNVEFIDDKNGHHVWNGDVHCGTVGMRAIPTGQPPTSQAWWLD